MDQQEAEAVRARQEVAVDQQEVEVVLVHGHHAPVRDRNHAQSHAADQEVVVVREAEVVQVRLNEGYIDWRSVLIVYFVYRIAFPITLSISFALRITKQIWQSKCFQKQKSFR